MRILQDILAKPERLIIGLMSGTSADGIDAAVIRLHQHAVDDIEVSLLAFASIPFTEEMRRFIVDMADPEHGRVDTICRMNFVLGERFAQAAIDVADTAGLTMQGIDLIGSHGQTIHHMPERVESFGVITGATLQIGDPSVIAQRTGVVTVGDFRSADIARGGQGAPLVPYVDYLLFRSTTMASGLLNIGGIANITVLPAGARSNDVFAFDTGPGNMVIDALAQTLTGQSMDLDGRLARTGSVSEPILETMLAHPFFALSPPKSTGRECFGQTFCNDLMREGQRLCLSTEDLLATATEITVRSVFESYHRYIQTKTPLDELIISGGGAKNRYLRERFSECFHPIRVVTADERGMSSDAKEAIAFAVLANQTIAERPGNLPGATGADRMTVLGKICVP